MEEKESKNFRKIINLSETDGEHARQAFAGILIQGEKALFALKSVRDMVLFTDRRIVALDVQGMTGKKKQFISYPYHKINTFAIESAGAVDLDGELDLWISEVGRVHFEFTRGTDMRRINAIVSEGVFS